MFFRRGIGLLFFAIVPFLASGQNILIATSSKSKVLQDIHGDEVMVREMGGSRPVVHVRDANQLNRHYFLMNKAGTDQVVGFHFDLQIPDVDCVKLSIYDMQVYGDSCYVCGEALIDQGAQDGSVLEPRLYSYGFVGRMGMADTVGGAWRVDYMFVYEVERLLQMDVFHPDEGYSGFKLLIVATGEMDDATKPSCLVEIKERADQGWEYSVMQTKKTGEVFTDVLARGNDLFVSSHVDCGEDPDDVEHWFHYVHHTWGKGFRDEYLLTGVFWEDAVKVDNRNLSPTPGGWGWHRSATTMRMCLLDDGKFCLSYAVENRATGEKGVIFYPLRDSYMWYPAAVGHNVGIDTWQYIWSGSGFVQQVEQSYTRSGSAIEWFPDGVVEQLRRAVVLSGRLPDRRPKGESDDTAGDGFMAQLQLLFFAEAIVGSNNVDKPESREAEF